LHDVLPGYDGLPGSLVAVKKLGRPASAEDFQSMLMAPGKRLLAAQAPMPGLQTSSLVARHYCPAGLLEADLDVPF
jgi:hypothetical protein